jgi:hypothetical protein
MRLGKKSHAWTWIIGLALFLTWAAYVVTRLYETAHGVTFFVTPPGWGTGLCGVLWICVGLVIFLSYWFYDRSPILMWIVRFFEIKSHRFMVPIIGGLFFFNGCSLIFIGLGFDFVF